MVAVVTVDVTRIAQCSAPVLITGETGAGKEVAALAIHNASGRRGAFVAVNCAALPDTLAEAELFGVVAGAYTGAVARPGAFVEARDGTLFLDEIGDAPRLLQAKLLRAIDSGQVTPLGSSKPVSVNARLVCATNVDLAAAVERREFRADLFHRIDVLRVKVPALREREDFASVVFSVLARVNGELGTRCVIDDPNKLRAYSWPGNVRELKNAITRACVDAGSGHVNVLRGLDTKSAHAARGYSERMTAGFVREREEAALKCIEAVNACGGSLTKAARMLGLNRTTLAERIRRYNGKYRDEVNA